VPSTPSTPSDPSDPPPPPAHILDSLPSHSTYTTRVAGAAGLDILTACPPACCIAPPAAYTPSPAGALCTYMLRLDDAELAIDTAGVATSGDTILPLILRYLVIFLFKFEFQFTLLVGVVGPLRVPTSNCVSSVLGSCSKTYCLITFLISSGDIAPVVGI
jgi:hypothetical protein